VKISIFGLTISSSWGNGHATPYRALLKALSRRGHSITFFEKDVDYYGLRRDFDSCPYCELVLYPDWKSIRRRALSVAAESDVVMVASFCPEGAQISDEVLGLSQPLKVFYDLDTPITLAALQFGDLDYLRRDQIPEFDLVMSFTGGRILRELEANWGAKVALPLYGCVDPDVYQRVSPTRQFRSHFSYMGTYAPDRQHKLDDLFLEPARRLPQMEFVLAGSMYPWEWRWPENVHRFDHVGPNQHPALYSSSRSTLNITRKEMAQWGHCPSGRFFEAAACGTPIVTDVWEGLGSFFELGKEVLPARNAEEVISHLGRTDEELAAVAKRARQRTLDQHTGEHRAQEMLSHLEQAMSERPRQSSAPAMEAA
jgi:spore maturation protein CgeB